MISFQDFFTIECSHEWLLDWLNCESNWIGPIRMDDPLNHFLLNIFILYIFPYNLIRKYERLWKERMTLLNFFVQLISLYNQQKVSVIIESESNSDNGSSTSCPWSTPDLLTRITKRHGFYIWHGFAIFLKLGSEVFESLWILDHILLLSCHSIPGKWNLKQHKSQIKSGHLN